MLGQKVKLSTHMHPEPLNTAEVHQLLSERCRSASLNTGAVTCTFTMTWNHLYHYVTLQDMKQILKVLPWNYQAEWRRAHLFPLCGQLVGFWLQFKWFLVSEEISMTQSCCFIFRLATLNIKSLSKSSEYVSNAVPVVHLRWKQWRLWCYINIWWHGGWAGRNLPTRPLRSSWTVHLTSFASVWLTEQLVSRDNWRWKWPLSINRRTTGTGEFPKMLNYPFKQMHFDKQWQLMKSIVIMICS